MELLDEVDVVTMNASCYKLLRTMQLRAETSLQKGTCRVMIRELHEGANLYFEGVWSLEMLQKETERIRDERSLLNF